MTDIDISTWRENKVTERYMKIMRQKHVKNNLFLENDRILEYEK